MISRGDLGQNLLEKLSCKFWIRLGVFSCAPHTSFDEINDSAVNFDCGELVGGSDLPWCTVLTLRPVICRGRDQASVKNTFGGWCVKS